MLPIDAVAYGPKGPSPLKGPDGQPLESVGEEPPLGGALARTGVDTWQVQGAPRPDVCAGVGSP